MLSRPHFCNAAQFTFAKKELCEKRALRLFFQIATKGHLQAFQIPTPVKRDVEMYESRFYWGEMSKIPLGSISKSKGKILTLFLHCLFQVESGKMKTLPLLFLLVASGACDDVKYISKRNSGRMERLLSCFVPPELLFDLYRLSKTLHWCFLACFFVVSCFNISLFSNTFTKSKETSLCQALPLRQVLLACPMWSYCLKRIVKCSTAWLWPPEAAIALFPAPLLRRFDTTGVVADAPLVCVSWRRTRWWPFMLNQFVLSRWRRRVSTGLSMPGVPS